MTQSIYIWVQGGCWVRQWIPDLLTLKPHYRWFPDERRPGYREMEVT